MSPEAASMLGIDWLPAEWPTTWDEKYGERALPIGSLLRLSDRKHRPSIVLIHERLEEEEEAAKLEAKMFGTIDVVLGTRFFRCFRIDAATIKDEKVKEDYAGKLPVLIFLDGRGEEVLRLQGASRASRVLAGMKKVFGDHFDTSMPKVLRVMNDLIDDIQKAEDKMADARKMLDEVEDRMADRDAGTAEKKIEKRREAYEEARAEFEKLLEKFLELANPPLKGEEAASKN